MSVTGAQRAQNAYNNLISGFWVGDINSGQFVSRSQFQGGPVTPTTPAQPTATNPWEYAQAVNVLYAMWKSGNASAYPGGAGDKTFAEDAGWRIGTEIRSLRAAFPDSTWESIGTNGALYAVDDCAWTCLMFLEYADCTHDLSVLPIVASIINLVLARWTAPDGGLWYSDPKTEESSYAAPLVFAMLWFDQLAGSTNYLAKAKALYQWAIAKLYRADGGFWEGELNGTPLGKSTPYQISEGSSVTYLAGEMFWSAVAARLNALSPSAVYVNQINATAAFILKYEVMNGHFGNFRDAATDAASAYFYAAFAIPLMTAANQATTKAMYAATAASIDPNATNPFLGFSAEWQGTEANSAAAVAAPDYDSNNLPVFAGDCMWAQVAQQF